MKVSSLLVAAALLSMQDDSHTTAPQPAGPAARVEEGGVLHPGSAEPPATEVGMNDVAPDFSFQAADGRWRHLHDLVLTGPVLLVFGATEPVLRSIERERERLLDLGVIPVTVVEGRSGPAHAMVQRLGLRYMVIADSRGVIAGQFNAVHPTTGRQLPCLFVLDRSRRVRALDHRGLPVRGFATLAANALGIAEHDTPVPTGR